MVVVKLIRILFGFVAAIFAATVAMKLILTSSIEGAFSFRSLDPFILSALWALCHYLPLYAMLLAVRWTSVYHIVGAAYVLSVAHNLIMEAALAWPEGLPINSRGIGIRDFGSISIATGAFALWLVAHADYSKLRTWAEKHVLGNALRALSACRRGCRAMPALMRGRMKPARGGCMAAFSGSGLSERWGAFPQYGNFALRALVGFAVAICAAVAYKSLFLMAVDGSAREAGFLAGYIPKWFLEIAIVTLAVYLPFYLVALIGQWTNVHHIVVWPYIINNSIIGLTFRLLDPETSVAVVPHEILGMANRDELSGLLVILSKAWVVAGAFAFWLVMHADHSKLRIFPRKGGSQPSMDGSDENPSAPCSAVRMIRAILLAMLGLLLYVLGAILFSNLPRSAIRWHIKAIFA